MTGLYTLDGLLGTSVAGRDHLNSVPEGIIFTPVPGHYTLDGLLGGIISIACGNAPCAMPDRSSPDRRRTEADVVCFMNSNPTLIEIGEVLRPRQGAVNVFQLAFHGVPMADPPFGPAIAPKHREAPWAPQVPICGRACKVEKGAARKPWSSNSFSRYRTACTSLLPFNRWRWTRQRSVEIRRPGRRANQPSTRPGAERSTGHGDSNRGNAEPVVQICGTCSQD